MATSPNPVMKKVFWLVGVIQLLVTTTALRDLRSRPASQVRGPKVVWALLCLVQPVGPLAYALVGRRRS